MSLTLLVLLLFDLEPLRQSSADLKISSSSSSSSYYYYYFRFSNEWFHGSGFCRAGIVEVMGSNPVGVT